MGKPMQAGDGRLASTVRIAGGQQAALLFCNTKRLQLWVPWRFEQVPTTDDNFANYS